MTGLPPPVPSSPAGALLGAPWLTLSRVTGRLLAGTALGLSMLGAATAAPEVVLLGAPGVGLACALVVAVGHPDFPRTVAARRAVWGAGTIGTLLLPFASGLALVGAAGPVIVLLLLTHGAVRVAASLTAGDADAVTRPDFASFERALPDLPTEALLLEWRSTEDRLGTADPRLRAETAQLRALLIDELTRRDPAGVARWLSNGGGDPGEHLSGEAGYAA